MVEFEWDEKKNLSNQKKNGIAFEDAIFVYSDSEHLSIPDLDHSEKEERWVTIGAIRDTRIIIVIHTEKDRISNRMRIISARRAGKKEQSVYIQSTKGKK